MESRNIIIRNVNLQDVPKIVELQKTAFPYMAALGVIWGEEHLEAHIRLFPEGQFCAEYDGKIIGSCSSLIVTMTPQYKEHTWHDVCGGPLFKNHTFNGDSLYAADVSTHPDYRRHHVASMLYDARKDLAIRMNLRRIIAGGRLYNYCEHAKTMSAQEYVGKVIAGEVSEPVLLFQLNNGFKFIKVLPNYLKDPRSLDYATFIEWKNPQFEEMQ